MAGRPELDAALAELGPGDELVIAETELVKVINGLIG
jgi:L-fucose mutarotase/ribose pyranase (RbsD/FucU family)